MVARIFSSARIKQKISLLQIEVHSTKIGLPGTVIVGSGGGLGRETVLRIRAVLRELGWKIPAKKYTISISPTLPTKIPSHVESAIAVGLLVAAECIPPPPNPIAFLGSTLLSGDLGSTPDLSALMTAFLEYSSIHIFIPELRGYTIWPTNFQVYSLKNLSQLKNTNWQSFPISNPPELIPTIVSIPLVLHTPHTFRFLEVVTLGKHSTLWYGPPGEGKTSLTCLVHALSPPYKSEMFHRLRKCPEAFPIQNIPNSILHETDVRLTTRQLSRLQESADLISFNDLPLYSKHIREYMQHILDQNSGILYLATMNPCACFAQPSQKCTCSSLMRRLYREKIPAALLDRFDCAQFLTRENQTEIISDLRTYEKQFLQSKNNVLLAQQWQMNRHKNGAPAYNAMYSSKDVYTHAKLTSNAWKLLHKATSTLQASARRTFSIARVARTVADLAHSDTTTEEHVALAIQLRPPNMLS